MAEIRDTSKKRLGILLGAAVVLAPLASQAQPAQMLVPRGNPGAGPALPPSAQLASDKQKIDMNDTMVHNATRSYAIGFTADQILADTPWKAGKVAQALNQFCKAEDITDCAKLITPLGYKTLPTEADITSVRVTAVLLGRQGMESNTPVDTQAGLARAEKTARHEISFLNTLTRLLPSTSMTLPQLPKNNTL